MRSVTATKSRPTRAADAPPVTTVKSDHPVIGVYTVSTVVCRGEPRGFFAGRGQDAAAFDGVMGWDCFGRRPAPGRRGCR